MSGQPETERLEQWTEERARPLFLGVMVGFFLGVFFGTASLVVTMAILWWLGYLEISLQGV